MKQEHKKCVITGHYPHELSLNGAENHPDTLALKEKLQTKLKELIDDGIYDFFCGMELGVELWAGEILLALKSDHPQLTVHAYLAGEHRTDDWSDEDRERYFDQVLPHCNTVHYASDQVTNVDVLFRNNQLAKEGDLFLAVWNGESGTHTADLVEKAENMGKEVVIVDSRDL